MGRPRSTLGHEQFILENIDKLSCKTIADKIKSSDGAVHRAIVRLRKFYGLEPIDRSGIYKKCLWCGKEFYVIKSRIGRSICCSSSCRAKYLISIGKINPGASFKC